MNFLELAKKRFSVRNFEAKKVEEEKLLQILETGRVAPTAANHQPQRIIVVRGDAGLAKVKKAANIYDAPLAVIVCADRNEAWKRPFDGKDTVDIDASIVTDHMMMEATELGLGTLWICYFKPDVLTKEFNIPNHMEPVNILAVGYPKGQIASPHRHDKARKPMQETVFYESL
jgi:nitroreductase